jgi:hypothetical protein
MDHDFGGGSSEEVTFTPAGLSRPSDDIRGLGMTVATKEKVMGFPIQAFRKTTIEDCPKGGLLLVGRDWWVRTEFVTQSGTRQSMLALTGQSAGAMGAVNFTPAITLSGGYQWEIRVVDPMNISASPYPTPRTVVLGEDGKCAIWGHIAGAPQNTHGFYVTGDRVDQHAHMAQDPVYSTASYQVWLLDEAGSEVGDDPLFEVGMT